MRTEEEKQIKGTLRGLGVKQGRKYQADKSGSLFGPQPSTDGLLNANGDACHAHLPVQGRCQGR